jgi:hypothetical protein
VQQQQHAGCLDDAAGVERLMGVVVLLQRELAGQQSAKEGLESKLKESKSSIDRKNVLIRCGLWREVRRDASRGVVEPSAASNVWSLLLVVL